MILSSIYKHVEIAFGVVTLLVVVTMMALLILFCIIPVNNYYYANGFVEYKNQFKVASQYEGIITEVLEGNYKRVKKNQPILRIESELHLREIETLSIKLKFLKGELSTLDKLYNSGAIGRPEVLKKKLEIAEVAMHVEQLKKNTINAPVEGNVYYKIAPEYIRGDYVKCGEVIAIIYTNEDKNIRISFPNKVVDRFSVGGIVHFRYKDPKSFTVRKMKGVVGKIFYNEKDRTVELFCEVTDGENVMAYFQPNTMVDASVIINTTSICKDLLGVDPFKSIEGKLMKNRATGWIFKWISSVNKRIVYQEN